MHVGNVLNWVTNDSLKVRNVVQGQLADICVEEEANCFQHLDVSVRDEANRHHLLLPLRWFVRVGPTEPENA